MLDRYQDLAPQVVQHLPSGMDALLDAAVLGDPALAAVRDEGRAVALLLPAPGPRRGIEPEVVFVQPHERRLAELVTAVEAGDIELPVDATYPLEHAAGAHRRPAAGGLRGRLVFTPRS